MASTRATRSWDADRFELQVGNQVLGCSQIRSHRSTRAIADRFELMASTRATRSWGCSQIRAHGVNQVLGMQTNSIPQINQVGNQGNQVLGCSQIRAHGVNQVLGMQTNSIPQINQVGNQGNQVLGMQSDSSSLFRRGPWNYATRPWDAVRFELTFPTDQPGRSLIDSSSWRQPGQPGPGMLIDSSSRWATRSWDAVRFDPTDQPGRSLIDSSSWRQPGQPGPGDADRFELMASTRATRTRTRGCSLIRAPGGQPGGQPGRSLIDSSSRWATRAIADRFELMASTRSWGCSQIRAHGVNQVLGMQTNSIPQINQVGNQGNQVLGCSQIRAHFSHRSTRAIADIFELMASTRATRSWDAVRFELMASTRSWGCRQIRSHRSTRATRWATKPWDADRFDPTDQPGQPGGQPGPGDADRFDLTAQPGGQPGPGDAVRFELTFPKRTMELCNQALGMQSDSSSWRQPAGNQDQDQGMQSDSSSRWATRWATRAIADRFELQVGNQAFFV